MYSKRISFEEKLIISILFNDDLKDIKNISKINFDRLIRIASSHLMLPSLYLNITKKSLTNLFPEEFLNYIEEIFILNKRRNNQLKKEIYFLSKMLNNKEIDHIFLKGSANIIYSIYLDNGERMVGDIDILINKDQINIVKSLLDNNGYYPSKKINFFESREKHIKRRINKKKKIGVEIHTRLTNSKNIIDENKMLEMKIKENEISLPDIDSHLKHIIYNWQINDSGFTKFKYSYRTIYDYIMINNKYKLEIFDNTKEFKDFLNTLSFLEIKKFEINEGICRKILRLLISSSKKIRFVYYKLLAIKNITGKIKEKLSVLFNNINYLKYLIKKHLKIKV